MGMRRLAVFATSPTTVLFAAGIASAAGLLIGGDDDGGGVGGSVDRLILLVLATYVTVCAASAAKSAAGRGRRGWTLIAVALGVWVLNELTVTYLVSPHQYTGVPLPAFHLVFTVLAALGMAQFAAGPSGQSRFRLVLDGVTVALCLLLLAWVLGLHRVYETFRHEKLALGLALLYPIADLVVYAIALVVLVRCQLRHRGALRLLVSAIGMVTFTHCVFAYFIATGHRDPRNLIDLGWAVSLFLFAAAALLSRQTRAQYEPPAALVPTTASLWLPYLPLLLAGTIGPIMFMSGLLQVLVPLIVVVVCLRQSVAAWENRRLLSATADQALRDPLTGLGNRALFDNRLAHAMMLRQRDDRCVAVVSLDLDDFKLINDNLGHPVADTLLIHAGQRLADCVRPGDTVARLGGDEFAVVLDGPADTSHAVAERVLEAFDQPFRVDGQQMFMRPSIGMAVASPAEPELDAAALVRHADIAMYAAKRSRLPRVHTFSADMQRLDSDVVQLLGNRDAGPAARGVARVRLLGELRNAIDRAELALLYQPKVELGTKRIVGVEALLRWPHPSRGLLRPDEFISLIRHHGLMRPVTDLVLDMALDDAVRWRALDVTTPVAVNLFAPLLRDTRLPDTLCRTLENRDLPAGLLTVEVTEDLALSELGVVKGVLARLRDRLIRVAIDDFGSGYSALSYLRDLPIDEVKLDRCFIESVASDARAAAVVSGIIDLAHDLGMLVVAEGVEDADTADWLRDQRCDVGQGYYFGRPVDAATITELIGDGGCTATATTLHRS